MNRVLGRYVIVGVLALASLLGSCTGQEEPEVPEVPGATETPTEGGGTEGATPTADPTDALDVPFECSELMTAGRVVQILKKSLKGEMQRVYNDDFLEDSGRTGRLTCSYGVPTGRRNRQQDPTVEIAVSSYTDAETAQGRIDTTVGATSRRIKQQTIAGNKGYLLTGDGQVTFVVAKDVRTYVISLRRGVVKRSAEVVVILDLAAELLDVPGATPTS